MPSAREVADFACARVGTLVAQHGFMADKTTLSPQILSPSKLDPKAYLLTCVVSAFLGFGLAMIEISATRGPQEIPEMSTNEAIACLSDCAARRLPAPEEDQCRTTVLHSTVGAWLMEEWTETGSDELLRSARIVPAHEGGEMVGFKVYGLRSQSPLAVLGLANGDTIHSVAGTDLSSAELSMEVYRDLVLGQPGELDVEIRRNGCPFTIKLTVI